MSEVSDHERLRQLALLYAHAWLMRDDELMASLWHREPEPAPKPDLDAYWVDALLPRWKTLGTTVLHVTNHVIEPIIAEIRTVIEEQAPKLEASKQRLSQLGPKPDKGQPEESADVARDRPTG